jgi:hypothetical protein
MDQNLTSFPDHAACSGSGPPVGLSDEGLTQRGTFQAPAGPSRCSVVVEFNFESDAEGNFPPDGNYAITITEVTPAGQSTTIDDPPLVTAPPDERPYVFVTQ